MSRSIDQSRSKTRAAQLAVAGAAMTLLVACGNDGEAETAVRDASIILNTGASSDVASRGSGSGSDSAVDFRTRRLQEALTSLNAHVGSGDSAYEGASAILAAVAENGLAIEEEGELISQLRELENRKTALRGMISEWWKHHAVAESSATFDPKDSVADLNRMTAVLEEDIAQVRQSKSTMDERIASLDAQIQEATTQRDAERAKAAQLELDATRATPAERPALAERVREHSRRADSYEFQAQRLETRAGQIRPDAAEKGRHVERLQKQLDLLEQSRQQIEEQQRVSADDAAAARRAAQKTEGELFEQCASINDFLINDLSDLASATQGHLRSAVSAAGKSGDSARESAVLAKASAQHRLGDLHDRMGQAHASLADLFEHLGSLSLDNASRFAELGAERLESAEQERQSAESAYADAARSFRSVRVRGDAKDALNALADRLEGVEPESLDEFGGEQPAEAFEDPGEDTGAGDESLEDGQDD